MLLRIAGQRLARDGYVQRLGDPGNTGLDALNRDVWAGRATLTLRPSDDLQNDTIFEVLSQRNTGQAYVLAAVNPAGLAPRLFPGFGPMLAQQQALGNFTLLPSDVNSFMSVHTWSLTGIFRYDITDDLTVRNIVSYFVSSYANQEDFDDTIFPVLDSYASYPGATKNHQITEEFQIVFRRGRLTPVRG